MRHVLSWTAVGLLFFLGGAPVKADLTFEASGTFGTDYTGTTGLAGGTFTATYEIGGLPVQTGTESSFDSFSVTLTPVGGGTPITFGSPPVTNSGGIVDYGGSLDIAVFQNSATGAQLVLDFSAPFNGTGSVIPTNLGYSYLASFYYDGSGNSVTIASGQSSPTAVPELPTSILTAGIGGLMLLGVYVRRRRAKFAG